jgi:hypothetical protein
MSGEGRLVVVRGIFFEKAVLTISVDCIVAYSHETPTGKAGQGRPRRSKVTRRKKNGSALFNPDKRWPAKTPRPVATPALALPVRRRA